MAKSTTEAEYIADNAGSDGVRFRNFMSELGYPLGATIIRLSLHTPGCLWFEFTAYTSLPLEQVMGPSPQA